jgi:hypothetical protein
MPLEVVIASLREPADFAGLPVIREGRVTSMAPPDWAMRLSEHEQAVLFLDEVLTVSPSVQASLMRVVLERTVGDLKLPDGIHVVAAGNPLEGTTFGYDLTPPLANRFCHLDWELKSDDWVDGSLRGWPEPNVRRLRPEWTLEIPAQMSLIASYIKSQPHKLNVVPDNEAQASKGYRTPRSWTAAARMITATLSAGHGEDLAHLFTAGCIGEAGAIEYWAWRRDLDLPDPEELLKNPSKYKHPRRGDQVFAVVTSVVAALARRPTEDRWLATWAFMEVVCKESGGDIVAAACKGLQGIWKPEWKIYDGRMIELKNVLEMAGLWKKK